MTEQSKKENTETQTNEVNFTEAASEIHEEAVTSAETNYQEVVEVEWDQVQPLVKMKQALTELENYTSDFLLSVERRKGAMFAQISELERAMYQQAQQLKTQSELNSEWSYELKLPEKTGDKGYFIRKEEN